MSRPRTRRCQASSGRPPDDPEVPTFSTLLLPASSRLTIASFLGRIEELSKK